MRALNLNFLSGPNHGGPTVDSRHERISQSVYTTLTKVSGHFRICLRIRRDRFLKTKVSGYFREGSIETA